MNLISLDHIGIGKVNTWMTGTYDFPISIIVKIEKYLGISIIKLD